jgi:RHS repeat-associated protein
LLGNQLRVLAPPVYSRVNDHAYGTTRAGNTANLKSDRTFTGQKQDGTGLLYYNARYYDPALGTFISPDTLVPDPGLVLDYNRYMYVRGNPLRYTDPTGHYTNDEIMQHFGCSDWACVEAMFASHNGGAYAGLHGWLAILLDAQDGYAVSAWNPLMKAWATGVFSRSETGAIMIQMNGASLPEQVFALTGGRYPGNEQHPFGLFGKYSLSWTDTSGIRPNQRRIERSATNGFRPDPCNTWDCVALGLDAAALGAEVFRDASLLSTPVSGPLGVAGGTYGQVATNAATTAGVMWTVHQHRNGNATDVDLAVSFATATAGQIPGLGTVAGAAQLLWDLRAIASKLDLSSEWRIRLNFGKTKEA